MASINENKSGTYRVRWMDSCGKRNSKSFKTLQEADIFKLEIELQHKKYGITPPKAPSKKFHELAAYWIDVEAAHKRSLKDDISIIRTHLLPRFGHINLEDISSLAVGKMRSELERKRSAKTVYNILSLLKTMLKRANELKWIDDIPTIKKPRIIKNRKNFSYLKTREQISELLAVAANEGEHIELFYLFAITTGMRLGEICGLTWDKVNFETRLIKVSCSYSGPTKTNMTRQIPIPNSLLIRLKRWNQKKVGALVFPNRSGNMYGKNPRISKAIFTRVLEKCSFQREYRAIGGKGNYIRFHDLRHTFASHYMMNGGDIFVLKEYLGHTTVGTTMIYAHLNPESFKRDYGRFDFISDSKQSGKVIEFSR